MKEWKNILPEEMNGDAFTMLAKEWMLVTAKKEDKVNTMTAAWGGFGIMWGKKVAYVVIRPQRYTKEFTDAADYMTLSFFGDKCREALTYLGRTSGRDEDKIAKSGLTLFEEDGVPCFEEARLNLICRKLYAQEMKEECFVDAALCDKWFAEKDFHTLYVVEIEKILAE